MLCYKEVHKYNGEYFSRHDNGYQYKIGEIAEAKGDYIYSTDSIKNVLSYNFVPYDMAILEMETVGDFNKNGCVITAKAVRVIREVTDYERTNKSRSQFSTKQSDSVLYGLLQKKRNSLLSEMQQYV